MLGRLFYTTNPLKLIPLSEAIINLESVNPIEFFGVNNNKFDILKKKFPLLKILSRGTQIKAHGMKAGVAINPDTDIQVLKEFISEIDLVCVMSVFPGFGGQKFIEGTYEKVTTLKSIIQNAGAKTLIEIDGGVSETNAAALVTAGADVLVAGTTVFKAADPIKTISALRNC